MSCVVTKDARVAMYAAKGSLLVLCKQEWRAERENDLAILVVSQLVLVLSPCISPSVDGLLR
jgi:hypothetical protein